MTEIINSGAVQFLFAAFVSLIGLVAHWFKRSKSEDSFASLKDYLAHNPMTTFRTISGLLAASAGVLALGVDVYTSQTISSIFLAGYAIDAFANEAPGDKK